MNEERRRRRRRNKSGTRYLYHPKSANSNNNNGINRDGNNSNNEKMKIVCTRNRGIEWTKIWCGYWYLLCFSQFCPPMWKCRKIVIKATASHILVRTHTHTHSWIEEIKSTEFIRMETHAINKSRKMLFDLNLPQEETQTRRYQEWKIRIYKYASKLFGEGEIERLFVCVCAFHSFDLFGWFPFLHLLSNVAGAVVCAREY